MVFLEPDGSSRVRGALWEPGCPLGAQWAFGDCGRAFGGPGAHWEPGGPLRTREDLWGPGEGVWGSGGPLGGWGTFEYRWLPSGLG